MLETCTAFYLYLLHNSCFVGTDNKAKKLCVFYTLDQKEKNVRNSNLIRFILKNTQKNIVRHGLTEMNKIDFFIYYNNNCFMSVETAIKC